MENNGILTKLLRDRESLFDEILEGKSRSGIYFQLILLSVAFFAIYGIVMGLFNSPLQALSSAVKVPVLFYLALFICYPALFMFNVLLGSKLSFGQSFALILIAYGIIASVLVSFAPISVFFMLIGSSYAFLRLLHVAVFTVAGIAGMKALNDGLVYACEKYTVYPRQGVQIFKIWILIFAFVGTQMAWNLRPFLGNKNQPFQLVRAQESNFYAHMGHTTIDFISGGNKEKPRPGITEEELREEIRRTARQNEEKNAPGETPEELKPDTVIIDN